MKENWKREMVGLSPQELAEGLAMAKAASVATIETDALVIGGDQLVSFDGEILGKPGTVDNAVKQLERISGRSHQLITSIAVRQGGKNCVHTDVTKLSLRKLTLEEIRRYVEFDRPLDCAGSYKFESRGIVLFEHITSDDQTAIVGLPLIALTSILREAGFKIP